MAKPKPELTQQPARISVDEVLARIGRGEDMTFVDTRNPKAWGEATTKLPGAVRVPAEEAEKHIADIRRDHLVVTYCT